MLSTLLLLNISRYSQNCGDGGAWASNTQICLSSFQVMECKDLNKMTASNLAIVFGPNLVWAKHNQMSLDEIGPINAFLEFVLQNHRDIYMVDINQKEAID